MGIRTRAVLLTLAAGLAAPSAARAADPWTIFLNFDGVDLETCVFQQWPQYDCSRFGPMSITAYTGDSSDRAAIGQIVRADLEGINVSVTDIRPPEEEDYDMLVLGDVAGWDPNQVGFFLPTDCGNELGGDINIVNHGSGGPSPRGPAILARFTLGQFGPTWGLEPVTATSDLMYSGGAPTADPTFVDDCFPLDIPPDPEFTAICADQHEAHCDPDEQNSYQELLALFGASEPSMVGPTIEFLNPEQGGYVPNDFDLEMSIVDDESPQALMISIDLDMAGPQELPTLAAGDIAIALKDVPDGEHTALVTAVDEDGNSSTELLTFNVGDPPDDTADGTDGETDDGETDDTDTATGEDTDDAGATTDDGGCGCTASPDAGPGALGLGLLALGFVRRRRRLAGVTVCAAFLAGCGSSDENGGGTGSATSASGSTSGASSDDGAGTDSGETTTTTMATGSGATTTAEPKPRPNGAPCDTGDMCMSGKCYELEDWGAPPGEPAPSYCSECSSDDDCAATIGGCEIDGGAGYASCSNGEAGRACETDDQCEMGLSCATDEWFWGPEVGVCSACSEDADCDPGQLCWIEGYPQGPGEPFFKQCIDEGTIPVEVECPLDEMGEGIDANCEAGFKCVPFPEPMAPVGICQTCEEDADCDAGEICEIFSQPYDWCIPDTGTGTGTGTSGSGGTTTGSGTGTTATDTTSTTP